MKKYLTLLLSLTIAFTSCYICASANVSEYTKEVVIATDKFSNYVNSFTANQGSITTTTWNQGTGFSEAWVNMNNANQLGYWTDWSGYLISKGGNVSRTLANTIDFSKEGVYTIIYQFKSGTAGASFAGINFYNDTKPVLGFGVFGNGTTNNPSLRTRKADDSGTEYTHDTSTALAVSSQTSHPAYYVKAEVIVNADGLDTINMKTYRGTETEGWNITKQVELNGKTANKVVLNNNGNHTAYYGFTVKAKTDLTHSVEIADFKGTDVEYANDNNDTTVWQATTDDYVILDLGAPYRFTKARFAEVDSEFSLYGGDTENLNDMVLITSGTDEVDLSSNTEYYRYAMLKGVGIIGDIDIWGEKLSGDYLNTPKVKAGSLRVTGNSDIPSSNESLEIEFEKNITISDSDIEFSVNGQNALS